MQANKISSPKTETLADKLSGYGRQLLELGYQVSPFNPNAGERLKKTVEEIKNDPLEFTPLSMRSKVVPYSKEVFGKDTGNKVGHFLRGTLAITPFRKVKDEYEPQTQEEKSAEQWGTMAMGTALTAPFGGASKVANVVSRGFQGATLGAGMNVAGQAIQGKAPTLAFIKEGALNGIETSWQLAFTNTITDKFAAKFVPSLTSWHVSDAFKLLKNASVMGASDQIKKQLLMKGASSLFKRALLEVPAENTMFTAIDKLSGKEKDEFIQAWVENLPGNVLGNLFFAAADAGTRGAYLFNKEDIDGAIDAFNKSMNTKKRGFVRIRNFDIGSKPAGEEEYPTNFKSAAEVLEEKYGVKLPEKAGEVKLTEAEKTKLLKEEAIKKAGMIDEEGNVKKDLQNSFPAKEQQLQQKQNIPISQQGVSDEQLKNVSHYQKSPQELKGLPQEKYIPEVKQEVSLPSGEIINPKSPYFNIKRYNVSDEAQKKLYNDVVDEVRPQIEKTVGKKLSNQEAIELANATSKTLHKVVTRDKTLDFEAQLLNARQKLAAMAEDGRADKEYIDTLLTVKSQATDIARKLQSFRINADPNDKSNMDMILTAVLKVEKDSDKVIKAAEGVDFNDQEQATAFYRMFIKPNLGDWADKLRYNSMLSSPLTHIVNSASNFQAGFVKPIEKTLTGGIDFLKTKLTGEQERQYYVGEGVEFVKGYWSKLHDASSRFAEVMQGRKISQMHEQGLYQIPLTTKGTPERTIENVLTFPGRLLQGMDEFFQVLSQEGFKKSLEYRKAKGTDVKGIEMQSYDEARKLLFNAPFESGKDSGQGRVLRAIDWLGQKVQEARSSDNAVVRLTAKGVLPFIRVPTQLFKQGLEYSPAGILTIPDAKEKEVQLAKAVMGISIAAGTSLLLNTDRITWAEPTDPDKKAAFRASGRQPYAIKIGDNWVSFAKLHPALSFNFAIVAAVKYAEEEKKIDESTADVILNTFAKSMNFFADQSYVKSLGDMVAAAKGDIEGLGRLASNLPSQFVPYRAFLSWVNNIIDPVQRQADSNTNILQKTFDNMAAQIPLLSESIPERLGPTGEAIPKENVWLNAISPIKITNYHPEYDKYLETALSLYKDIKTLPPDQANAEAERIYNENPVLFSKIKQLKEDEDMKVTDHENKLKAKSIGDMSRANFITRDLNKLKTGKEKDDYLKRLWDLGIVNETVMEQLRGLVNRGVIEPPEQ